MPRVNEPLLQRAVPGLCNRTAIDHWVLEHTDIVGLIILAAGFLLRIKTASGTFLNADEALHFSIANQASFADAYRASLSLAHPPFLIFLLYFWRYIGTSELMLRLPSVIAGTVFCWLSYRWLKKTLGSTAGLIGLLLTSLLLPIVALSAELRQYSLLLMFMAAATLLLEIAFAKSSAVLMASSSTCLWLAMLSHYSGLLFAAAFGVYSLLCLIRVRPAGRLIVTWAAGQLGAVSLVVLLYGMQISQLKDSAMAEHAKTSWLQSSYYESGHNLLAFIVRRSFGLFHFIFGQVAIGDIAALAFLAGAILLLRRKSVRGQSAPSPLLGIYLLLPFAINCALAIMRRYPYGGTRHSVFLAMYAVAGIAFFGDVVTRHRPTVALACVTVLVAICYTFGFHEEPYMTREDQSRSRMDDATEFIHSQIPAAEPIFVDYQTGLLLGHYLCRPGRHGRYVWSPEDRGPGERSGPQLLTLVCAEHKLMVSSALEWTFTDDTFQHSWDDFVAQSGLKPGSNVWVVQAGWRTSRATGVPRLHDNISRSDVKTFGHNISAFRLTVAPKAMD
jgi:Dolichyl-phosphate-mannose-protein mannosyltransferase